MPNLNDLKTLSPQEREVLLDVGQVALDIVGIVEPTPFADITNGLIFLWRGDAMAAAISGLAIVPYVGDVGKLARLPRYERIVVRAIELARVDRRFADLARPILSRIVSALDSIPLERMPSSALLPVERLRNSIDAFLGAGRAMSKMDRLTNEMLRRVFGSTQNVGPIPRRNVRKAVEFFERYGVEEGSLKRWAEIIKGMDLHALEPVKIVTFKRGDVVAQYVDTGRHVGTQVGDWLVLARGSVSPRNLGLSGAGREFRLFRVKDKAEVLLSTAGPNKDFWTAAIKAKLIPPEHVAGGGHRSFLPNAKKLLDGPL